MKKYIIRALVLSILVLFCGCAIKSHKPVRKTISVQKQEIPPLNKRYQILAMRHAINHEFQKALYFWEIAGKINPEDRKIPIRADGLKAFLENESERHYIRGLKAYQDNLPNMAKNEFLTALRYHPRNREVLNHLKNMTTQYEYSGYTVQEGDTFRDIAQKVYQDPDMDFLVAHILGQDETDIPISGQVLNLPSLDKALGAAPKERSYTPRRKKIRRIKKRKKPHHSAMMNKHKVLEKKAPNKASDARLYQEGILLYEEKKYQESLSIFSKMDPSYKDVHDLIGMITTDIDKASEEHYHKGVKLFIQERIAEAIDEWEKTLALNPGHEKASRNIEDAKSLLEKLEEVE